MKRIRGGELGRALGCNCSSGAKTGYGFRAALGRAVGRAFAVRRTAGPARWAFGPPPERAARTQKNWVVLWAELLRLAESRGPKPPAAEGRIASFAASLYPKPRRLRPLELKSSSAARNLWDLTHKQLGSSTEPPRAAAIMIRVHWIKPVMEEFSGQLRLLATALMPGVCCSVRRACILRMRAIVVTVFSCVASRAHRAFYWQPLPENWLELPYSHFGLTPDGSTSRRSTNRVEAAV